VTCFFDMSRANRFVAVLGILLLGLLSFACATGVGGRYQLRKVGEDLVVVPPPYWQRSAQKPVKVTISVVRNSPFRNSSECSAASGPFRLALTDGSQPKWSVTLPSFAAWQASILKGNFSQEFADFLDDLGKVETSGCLSAGIGALVERVVREGIPVRSGDTLYYRYDWQPGEGFVNLEPGMRVKIERAEFGSSGHITGTTAIYYLVGRDSHRAISFRRVGPKSGNLSAEQAGDRALSTRIRDMPYVRLFLSGEHVPNNLRYTALIVGTQTQAQMAQVEGALRAHPEVGCPRDTNQQVDCVIFRGSVTVSTELEVAVNGHRGFVGLEDGVQSLFDPPRSQCAPESLRIERQFLDRYAPIEFGAECAAGLDLTLVGGDRVACSASR